MTLTHIFRYLFPRRHRVETDEYSCDVPHLNDPQVKTYMYGGGISEWEGTTKWVVRHDY